MHPTNLQIVLALFIALFIACNLAMYFLGRRHGRNSISNDQPMPHVCPVPVGLTPPQRESLEVATAIVRRHVERSPTKMTTAALVVLEHLIARYGDNAVPVDRSRYP